VGLLFGKEVLAQLMHQLSGGFGGGHGAGIIFIMQLT